MSGTGTVERQHTDNTEAGMTSSTAARRLADPKAPYWTMDDIAEYWGIKPGTVRDYRYKTEHPKPGRGPLLPPNDDKIGINPVWFPSTIISFDRSGKGHGGGPKPANG